MSIDFKNINYLVLKTKVYQELENITYNNIQPTVTV